MNFVNNQSNIRQVISLKKSKNIIQYKKSFNINIGVIIFIIIFIYLIFNIFSYLTETHISVYEVEQGTIAVNNVYHGLILREEKLFPSIYNGSLNYYVKEGSKIAYGDLIYSVDETGNVASIINEANKNGANLDKDSLNEIEESISDFQSSYRSGNFYQVYSFKENINDSLSEALSVGALNEISDYLSNANDLSTFHKVYADANGIIVYYTDGLETVTTDNFTEDMFNEAAYQKANLKSGNTITSGCTAYKLIDSEYWNIVIPIPESTASLLNDDDTIRIRFLKDDKETYATYSISEKNGQQYLILSLKSGMVRYALERYVEVELLLSEETGLKIPNSAITEKEFFVVPKKFFQGNDDSDTHGILVEQIDKKGNQTVEYRSPSIYYATEDAYYIDSEQVSSGDILKRADSDETYTIGQDTTALQGVYNINKGYAVFKQIEPIYQSDEYTIIKKGTSYGISLYDHIALDGSKINENQLIH